jgi:vacuolar-type H+-ATPase subunit F/Vma7
VYGWWSLVQGLARLHSKTEVLQRSNPMQGFENIATQFDPNIPFKSFQRLGLSQCQEKQRIHELATRHIIAILTVCALALDAPTQRLQRNRSQMLCIIVIIARNKGIQPARKTIDRQFVRWIVLIWEDYMEVSIQVFRGNISEILGHQ